MTTKTFTITINFGLRSSAEFTLEIEIMASVNILRTKKAMNLKFFVRDYTIKINVLNQNKTDCFSGWEIIKKQYFGPNSGPVYEKDMSLSQELLSQ